MRSARFIHPHRLRLGCGGLYVGPIGHPVLVAALPSSELYYHPGRENPHRGQHSRPADGGKSDSVRCRRDMSGTVRNSLGVLFRCHRRGRPLPGRESHGDQVREGVVRTWLRPSNLARECDPRGDRDRADARCWRTFVSSDPRSHARGLADVPTALVRGRTSWNRLCDELRPHNPLGFLLDKPSICGTLTSFDDRW